MDKEQILEISRKENKNRDLAELEATFRAGSIASRVGATVCILLSVSFHWVMGTVLFSPWIIYSSIMATHSFVKYTTLKRKTDLLLSCAYSLLCLSFMTFFVLRLFGSIE